MMLSPERERAFWKRVDKTGDCWEWLGSKVHGYGTFSINAKSAPGAHRIAYKLLVGPIPEGLQLDHLCRNRACVNPAHLEPVTCRENIRRGETAKWQKDKTHCPSGHPYDEANTSRRYGKRYCRACHRSQQRAYHKRKRSEKAVV